MTRRRKRFLIGLAVILLGLIAIQSTMFVRPSRIITIEVDGAPGQSVIGAFDVDGTRYEQTKELPANFTFQARDVFFAVTPDGNASDDYLEVDVYRDDELMLTCRDKDGVTGQVMVLSLLGLGSANNGIGGIRPD